MLDDLQSYLFDDCWNIFKYDDDFLPSIYLYILAQAHQNSNYFLSCVGDGLRCHT